MSETATGLALLRVPFPPEQIGKLPKPTSKENKKGRCPECGGWHGLPAIHLDYVGHAELTNRLLDADPLWTWEPLALENGLPKFDENKGLWIKLTVCGHTRMGYGASGYASGPDGIKEAIGDALRNAAMRFGAALYLWAKSDLTPKDDESIDKDTGEIKNAKTNEEKKEDFSGMDSKVAPAQIVKWKEKLELCSRQEALDFWKEIAEVCKVTGDADAHAMMKEFVTKIVSKRTDAKKESS